MSHPPYYAHARTVRMRPLPVILPNGTHRTETMDTAICLLANGVDQAAAARIADALNGNEAMTWSVLCALRHLDRIVEQRQPTNTRRAGDDAVWEARSYLRQALGLATAEATPVQGEPVK